MTVQSPPYALQNSAHTAALFRQASTSLVTTTGVGGPAELQVNPTSGMTVAVAAGRAWIPGTSVTGVAGQKFSLQGNYFAVNDAQVNLTVATADAVNPRIDVVYIAVTDSFYTGTDGVTLGVVTGTPAPGPVQPAIPTNALLLAYVAVGANTTNIVGANINDKRGVFGVFGESTTVLVVYSPSGPRDSSLSTTSTVPWLSLGSIFIPPWATTAQCLTSVNGYYPNQPNTISSTQTQLGPRGGAYRTFMAMGAAGVRAAHVVGDTLDVTSLAGTQQAVTIATLYNSGTGGMRADAYTTATVQVTFT